MTHKIEDSVKFTGITLTPQPHIPISKEESFLSGISESVDLSAADESFISSKEKSLP